MLSGWGVSVGYDGCVCWAANVAMILLWYIVACWWCNYSTIHENTVMQWYIVCGITRSRTGERWSFTRMRVWCMVRGVF